MAEEGLAEYSKGLEREDMTWTREQHAAARKACEAATPGPWTHEPPTSPGGWAVLPDKGGEICVLWPGEVVGRSQEESLANGSLIALARTALPAALDHIEALEAKFSYELLAPSNLGGMRADLAHGDSITFVYGNAVQPPAGDVDAARWPYKVNAIGERRDE